MAEDSPIGIWLRRFSRSFLLCGALLAACSPQATPPAAVQLSPTATRVAPTLEFTTTPQTATPIRLWAGPGLPAPLLELITRITEIDGRPVAWSEPGLADIRVEAAPERPLTRWIYAAVAPFPTLADDISASELRQRWHGSVAAAPLYLSSDSAAALGSVFGAPDGQELLFAPPGELLELAWDSRPSIAIVPFEELDPAWKVLSVDGQSPIRKDFDPAEYALTVDFGLSGDPAVLDVLVPELQWPASNRDPGKLTTVLMTGVTALVRGTAYRMELYGPKYPGFEIGDWLREADLAHVSHEAAFSEFCPSPEPLTESLRFCAAPEWLALFDDLGIDLIELTGNHLLDYGPEALLYSLARYRELGMQTFGGGADLTAAREPAIVVHNGNRLAFIGCNAAGPPEDWAAASRPGALPCNDQQLLDSVTALSEDGFLVIFTYQWPESLNPRPLPKQIEGFRAAVDAGAVVVSGSQAHLAQSMEFYADRFIHYGLGNLFFDQMYSLEHRQEFLDRHVFYEGRHISTELLTAILEDFSQPRPMNSNERAEFLERMFEASGW